jgi:hypothetical protein
VLTAHVSLETASGRRMFNFNFGGIKGTSPEGATARYLTHEVVGGRRVKVEQSFRAYGSAEGGAADYLGLLRARFPDAARAADAGDARGFAERLGRAGYYTAPVSEYAAAIERLAGAEAAGGGRPTGGGRVADAGAAPRAGEAAAPAGAPLGGAELGLLLDALSVAGAARIAAPDDESA